MAFRNNPTTTGTPANTPVGTVAVPNHANGDLTALRGANASTDSNGNETAAVAVFIENANPNGQAPMVASASIAIASDQSNLPGNTKQLNGTTISVNAGTVDAGSQRVVQGGAATGTKSNVASSASSVTILASNTSRKNAIIYNDSTQILYLDLSGGTASSSSYSVQMPSQSFFELPGPTIYNGAITGIWAAVNGSARITEFS